VWWNAQPYQLAHRATNFFTNHTFGNRRPDRRSDHTANSKPVVSADLEPVASADQRAISEPDA